MIHTGVPGGTRLSVISPGEPGNSGGAAVYGRRSILYVYVLSLQFIPCTITITNFVVYWIPTDKAGAPGE